MASVQSAEGFTKRLTALAYSAVGKEPPAQEQTAGVPLVPIYVGIDTDHAGQQQQLREVGSPNKWPFSCCIVHASHRHHLLHVSSVAEGLPMLLLWCPCCTDFHLQAWRYVLPALLSICALVGCNPV